MRVISVAYYALMRIGNVNASDTLVVLGVLVFVYYRTLNKQKRMTLSGEGLGLRIMQLTYNYRNALGDGCLECLPVELDGAADSVRLIDVVWLDTSGARVVAAFEVEHSTSIYSGIVRMLDLALGCALGAGTAMFLVAPDDRRDQVAQQLRRPAFSRVSELGIRYLPYGELRLHRAAIGRFGTGLKPILEVSQAL